MLCLLSVSCISPCCSCNAFIPLPEDKAWPIPTSVNKIVQSQTSGFLWLLHPPAAPAVTATPATLFQLSQSRQKHMHAKPAEYLITHTACDYVCLVSSCALGISKHGNHKIGNTRAGGTGAVTVLTTFSAYTDVSRYGICFGLYGLVRFFPLSVTGTAFWACLLMKEFLALQPQIGHS